MEPQSIFANSLQSEGLSWLITGGCGFIGAALVKYLTNNEPNAKIRILDNLSTGSKDTILKITSVYEKDAYSIKSNPKGVELVAGDVRDPETCLRCCNGVDNVVHLAANSGVSPSVQNPRLDMEANVIGTFNMLDSARQRGVKKFIFASSGATLGDCEPPINERMIPKPISPYGASKLAGEGYCFVYYRTYGLETVVLRFGNVYGPWAGHKNSVVAKFIRQAINGEFLEVYGNGDQTRDFIFIDDLVMAICLATTAKNVGGELFQIATNIETTVNGLVQKLLTSLSHFGIENVKVHNTPPKLGDVKRNFSDISKAHQILGWKPRTSLEEGLVCTVKWFVDNRNENKL